MSLSQLSLSYRCHSSIGNSLDLKTMMQEVIKTFLQETNALHGSFYVTYPDINKIVSIGKKVKYDIELFSKEYHETQIVILPIEQKLQGLLYKLENGLLIISYDNYTDMTIIQSIFESFRSKLNISINSCLNVEKLKEKNRVLESVTKHLQDEIDKAIEINHEKERQIFEQLKMSQMGELIGNIAHQWRQPLTVISTAVSGMKLKKEMNILSDDDFLHYINIVIHNTGFLSNTIDEFRDYIKESHRQKEVVIQERVKIAFNLVASSYEMENIEIIEDSLDEEPIYFKLVLGELLQVLISILNNAKEALVLSKVESKWVKYSVYKDEYSVYITIEDNAGGIKDEIVDKIFNPYFTTKHEFHGTGIGLYTGYDIIVNHLGGRLYVNNTKHGAKFTIELPFHTSYVI